MIKFLNVSRFCIFLGSRVLLLLFAMSLCQCDQESEVLLKTAIHTFVEFCFLWLSWFTDTYMVFFGGCFRVLF